MNLEATGENIMLSHVANVGPLMVGRTVAQYMLAGVAALHLEDQVVNKRCGHLKNKELVPEDVYLSRIRAAVNMRYQMAGDIVIIARTDALQSMGYEAAASRLKNAIMAGADMAFLEGITTEEEARKICRDLEPTPVMYNMVQGGLSPHLSVAESKKLGFRAIIYPSISTRAVYEGVTEAVKELKGRGDITAKNRTRPFDVFSVCGLQEAICFDAAAGGQSYTNGVD